MKGIILAGGTGSRLYPLTNVTSKQLLPVYDKPMIYYPLSTLMLAGINEILIISTVEDREKFEALLGDGSRFGIQLSYAIQERPEGIAQAFLIAEDFLQDDSCALILGDNLFYGGGLSGVLERAIERTKKGIASVFGHYVQEPQRFGIMELDMTGKVLSVEEKPAHPKTNYAITGMYFYDNTVVEKAKRVRPSERGELEITSVNQLYLEEERLYAELLGRGFAWIDAGTIESLAEASEYIRIIEKQQNVMIAAIEEVAYRNGWISKEQLLEAAKRYGHTAYATHLQNVATGRFWV